MAYIDLHATETACGVRYVKAMGVKVIKVREKCWKQGSKFYDSLYFGFSLFSGKRKYLGKIRFLQSVGFVRYPISF